MFDRTAGIVGNLAAQPWKHFMINNLSVRQLFWFSFVLTVICTLTMQLLNASLITSESPAGILSLQFSPYYSTTAVVLENWTPRQKLLAMFGLGFDYLYMVSYSATIFLGLMTVASNVPEKMKASTLFLTGFTWLAGGLDAAENYFHMQLVLTSIVDRYAWPATICATMKFLIIAITAGWLIAHARHLVQPSKPNGLT